MRLRAKQQLMYVGVAGLITAAALAVGFQVGRSTSSRSGAEAREKVLTQLVSAKASIEAGLSLSDLSAIDQQLRASVEMASLSKNDLGSRSKAAVTDAINAISLVKEGWQETISNLCTYDNDFIGFSQGMTYCHAKLENIFMALNLFQEFRNLEANPPSSPQTIISAMLHGCLPKITHAVATVSAD